MENTIGKAGRKRKIEKKNKMLAKEILDYVLNEIEIHSFKIGALLCEGDENSIDKAVYSAIFPNLVIVPLGSCTTIMRLLPKVKNYLSAYSLLAFGIIDRDALSKIEIKKLHETIGVYTTKLPFIENIICSPEVLVYVCSSMNLDYDTVLKKIQNELIKNLWRQLKERLPINIGINKNERIQTLIVQVGTRQKNVTKEVDRANILYVYRDKVVISIVANALGIEKSKNYYLKVAEMLKKAEYRDELVKVMSNYVPKLEIYDFD